MTYMKSIWRKCCWVRYKHSYSLLFDKCDCFYTYI